MLNLPAWQERPNQLGGEKAGGRYLPFPACCATSGGKRCGQPRTDESRQPPDRLQLADDRPTAVVEPCDTADAERVARVALEANHVACQVGPAAAVTGRPFADVRHRAGRAGAVCLPLFAHDDTRPERCTAPGSARETGGCVVNPRDQYGPGRSLTPVVDRSPRSVQVCLDHAG